MKKTEKREGVYQEKRGFRGRGGGGGLKCRKLLVVVVLKYVVGVHGAKIYNGVGGGWWGNYIRMVGRGGGGDFG